MKKFIEKAKHVVWMGFLTCMLLLSFKYALVKIPAILATM